jgi:ribosomal protein L10
MIKPLLSTKLRNQIHAIDSVLLVTLRNISVNGVKFGCSGFIYDPRTDRTVYVNTDHNHQTNTRALYRTARDTKDYTGGPNHFASYEDVAAAAVKLLTDNR